MADPIRRAIALKLAVIARQLRQRFDERAEQLGVTRAQWSLIATVARQPGATQRVIGASLEVTDVTAGRLIERLCKDGYLERRPHPRDRRAYCVYLTPAATPMLAQLGAMATAFEEDIFQSLAGGDLEKLNRMLGTVAENLARKPVAASATTGEREPAGSIAP